MYFLTTERLGFRPWTEHDLDLALELWGDPQVSRWIDRRLTLDRNAIEHKLETQLALERDHGVQYWPIFLRADGRHVGCCGLQPYREQILELGFHLRAEHWGRGLGYEAADGVIRHAFNELRIEELFAGHHPDNRGSKRLLAKLGFRFVGHEHYEPTGVLEPCYRLRRGGEWQLA